MIYFIETNKLLSEPTFITFAQEAYHDFIRLDIDDCIRRESNGETYTFNTIRWLSLAKKDEPRRFFSGGSGSFILYMRYEVERVIHEDWEHFKSSFPSKEKDQLLKISDFLAEAAEVGRVTKTRQHLEPLYDTIQRLLGNIVVEYGEQASKPVKATINGQDINLEPMQWNASVNILTTLFYDLSKWRISKGGMALNANTEQMKAFILNCFVDKDGNPFSKATIDTYFQEDKPEKKAKDSRKVHLTERFKHE